MPRLKDNPRLNKVAIELVEELTELKRIQYYRDRDTARDNDKRVEIEDALIELGIDYPKEWTPELEMAQDYDEDV